jgi:hypothetical protein
MSGVVAVTREIAGRFSHSGRTASTVSLPVQN